MHNARRIDVVKMCEDCRVEAVVNESFDPHVVPRPPTMTTEDYFRTREANKGDSIKGYDIFKLEYQSSEQKL